MLVDIFNLSFFCHTVSHVGLFVFDVNSCIPYPLNYIPEPMSFLVRGFLGFFSTPYLGL